MTGPPSRPASPLPARVIPAAITSAQQVEESIAALVHDTLALSAHDDPEVARAIVTGLERLRNVAVTVSARATATLMRAGTPRADGAVSSSAWLADQLGVTRAEAARRTALADTISVLPETEQALLDGRIGENEAVVIAQAVRRGRLGDAQQTEADLLGAAFDSTPEQLRHEVKRREDAADGEAIDRDERLAHARRRAWWSYRDGMVHIGAQLDPANGAMAIAALEAMVLHDPSDTPEELRRTGDQLRADALTDALLASLDDGAAPAVGGVRPHVNIVVQGVADDSPRGWRFAGDADGVGPLSGRALERFWCDCTVRRAVVDADGMPLDIGRADRKWPTPIRTAIALRDLHCRFPGCDRPPLRCIVHHVTFWEDGGTTGVDNGILLCRYHHHVVHDLGWRLTFDPLDATVTVRSPDGHVRRSHRDGAAQRRRRP